MRIIYNNLVDSVDVLSESSENSAYPSSNVQDTRLVKVWRTVGGDLSSQSIVFDAGATNTFTVDCAAILNHNFTNAATLKFEMHTADSWGTPDLSETLTWRSGVILKFFTSTTKRFMRFFFTDAANTDNYLEIGRLFASVCLQITPSSLSDFTISNVRTDRVSDSISNQMYSDIGVGFRTFNYSFPKTEYTMISSLRTAWDTVGMYKPFIFLNFDTRYTEIEPAYVRFNGNFTEEWKPHNMINYSLELRETN